LVNTAHILSSGVRHRHQKRRLRLDHTISGGDVIPEMVLHQDREEWLVFLLSKALLRQGFAWHGKTEPAWKFGESRHWSLRILCDLGVKKAWEDLGAPGGDKCTALSVASYPFYFGGPQRRVNG
jgi:hypothetical protein